MLKNIFEEKWGRECEMYDPYVDNIDDYILEPNIFFKNTFEDLIQNNLNEQFPISPKDRILTFLKYVLSATGQGDVLKDGYLPVTQKIAQKSLISIGVE